MLEQRIGKVEGSAILELGLRKPLVAGWCEVYRRGYRRRRNLEIIYAEWRLVRGMVLACFPATHAGERTLPPATRLYASRQAMLHPLLQIGIFGSLSFVFHARVPKWSCCAGWL